MIQVFIIDDHPMVIEGIKTLLGPAEEITIVGSATDAFAALDFLKKNEVDVVLLDINLPEISGLDLCQDLKKQFPGLKILGLSTFKERSYINRMISQGASGYLLKSTSREELSEAIMQAYRGRIYLNSEVAKIMAQSDSSKESIPVLTSREKEVLELIAAGMTNQQIAEKLFISPLTVDSHRKNLLAKLEVKNTALMIKVALEKGLI